ncbi:SDR family NAD(P)-dependent oxidoreductase [Burkholderia glumae]|uniref:SDR family NAD(P)-dependent oxidoreductase n=1 Tax=Burkholderia glumae TaxID=337 RepID=UPI002164AA95|nr:SDR family oxidoreductase [Burkholderia glumae]UVS95996.1 SDR family oxidoreductase [Burkholderia glumae]
MSAPAGRAVLVTGGTRGIGAAIARRLAAAGWRVAASYRHDARAAAALERELAAAGLTAAVLRADVTDPHAARALAEEAARRLGGLDALVNNAGMVDDGAFVTLEAERYLNVLRTNLLGAIRVTGAALPHLLRGRAPAVVNLASLGGVAGKEGQVAYAASKGGLIGFTHWLARRYAAAGLTANAVAPGFIDTEMIAGLTPAMTAHIVGGSAARRVGQADEVARAVAFLLEPGYLHGTTLRLDGGFNR